MKTINVTEDKITQQRNKYGFKERVIVTNRVCTICKNKFYYGSGAGLVITNPKVTTDNHPDNGACSNCQHWVENLVADMSDDSALVIKGEHYRFGNTVEGVEVTGEDTKTSIYYKLKAAKKGTGFGGDPFIVRRDNGQIIVTTDMWHQGDVPETFSNPDLNDLDIPSFIRNNPMKNNAQLVEV